jgi:hypothetical protein
LRRSILACGLLLAFAGMATAAAAAAGSSNNQPSTSTTTATSTTVGATAAGKGPSRWELRAERAWRRHIRHYRADTRHWLTVMRGRPPASVSRSLSARSLAAHSFDRRSFVRLRQLARRLRHRAHRVQWHAKHPPGLRGWLCIHRYEGSWVDTGGPYWGGLQMDLSFQATYGGWLLRRRGTADHWSPLEQIWVAVRAARVRGFSPWPSTAHYCGLL